MGIRPIPNEDGGCDEEECDEGEFIDIKSMVLILELCAVKGSLH